MDKIEKKGIALFITLLIIASILSIVAVSFSYLEKAKRDSSRVSAIIQGNILYRDTVSILRKFFPKGVMDSKKAQLIYSVPLVLEDKKSEFNIVLECKPLLVAVPINWYDRHLLESKDKKGAQKYYLAEEVLDKLARENNIEELDTLKSMLKVAIEREDRETEDGIKSRVKPKAKIYSKAQFESILTQYFFKTEDSSVFKIDWERYFIFIDVTKNAKIDGVYITPELISLLFDIPLDSVREEWKSGGSSMDEKGKNLKDFLVENGIDTAFNGNIFSTKPLNAMRCEERFFYKDRHYGFKFDYSNERSVNFEFIGEI